MKNDCTNAVEIIDNSSTFSQPLVYLAILFLQRLLMEAPPSPPPQPPYLKTVATQILICLGLYLSLNIGDPSYSQSTTNNLSFYYFISVTGGFRPPLHQTLLLKQMEKVARSYDAQFVLTIGELGLQDPLLQNATRNFPRLKIPWYATKVSYENESGHLSKQIRLPSGRSMEIIVLDSDIPKDDALHISRLQIKLKATESDSWRFVVGLNPLESCKGSNDSEAIRQTHKLLHDMFSRYQVNAYLSRDGCEDYTERGGVAYMSHPCPRGASDGFLLHKVGLLEIETYHVNLDGKVVRKMVLHQIGHEAM